MIFDNELMEEIQNEFPRARMDAGGSRRVFLDNGAGTLVLKRSAEAQYSAALDYSANIGHSFMESRKADEFIYEGLRAVAALLNTGSPDTIVSGQTATSLLYQLSYALGKRFDKRHNIVTTFYEHLANVDPWRELERRGVVGEVRFARLHKDGTLDMEHLRSLVDEYTKVITISAASNLLGSKSPLMDIGNIAREVGAFFVVDAVHHAAHGSLDVQEIGCDFLVLSAYKFFSPKYISFMYGKKEHLESLSPYTAGKNHASIHERWQWGSPDHAKHAAMTATVEYLTWLGDRVQNHYEDRFTDYNGRVRSLKIALSTIEQYEKDLSRAMLTGFDDVPGLLDISNIRVYGLSDSERLEERDPTFAFHVENMKEEEVERRLVEEYNISIRAFESWSMAEDFFEMENLPIRASLVHYNTLDEVNFFLKALKAVCTG